MTPTPPRPAPYAAIRSRRLKIAVAGILAAILPTTAQAQQTDPSAAAVRLTAVARAANTPEDLYGKLYRAVELARVFPDGKAFADMVPRTSPTAIMAAYAREQPTTRAALAAFVDRFFSAASEAPPKQRGLRAHIRALWPVLIRAPLAVPPGGSSLQLPAAFVVPGGRFQEIYYWDSYFTMLGLRSDGQQPLVDAMLTNFVSLIERYGHVPNGTRSYYLSRSQPPFFALMLDLSSDADAALARRRLAALRTEYAFWMAGSACLDRGGACQHVVRMPDGSLLNRYWDARDTPRDESYAEDVATAAATARTPDTVYRDLRAGAESGWDFGSRWLRDGSTLTSIHTTDIVPVDLNSLLWFAETSIARRCAALADARCAADFTKRAARRAAAITRYLWLPGEERFGDWDRSTGRATPTLSAATLYPLFVGLASPGQAKAVARTTAARLLAPGGVRTTLNATGQQWDAPNGWAPLQWIAIAGLERNGAGALARTAADRWLATVNGYYRRTGKVIEKYDVEHPGAGGGGEYDVQEGFGWTNGVTSALMARYQLTDDRLP
uniref:alpha,alpha-trehalase TreF n=1 Tax=uncultured Sphingomonas sp. TaxID=158754 RepID=UPI0035C9DD03